MIRSAEKKDIPRIMELLHQVNDVHAEGRPDLFVKGSTKYQPEELPAILANPESPVFVYEDSDSAEVEGYCFCIVQDHTADRHLAPVKTLYIDDLCVDAACRGKKVGTQLYDYVKKFASGGGFHNITLNVWSCNPSAMKFYEHLGLIPYKICLEQPLTSGRGNNF